MKTLSPSCLFIVLTAVLLAPLFTGAAQGAVIHEALQFQLDRLEDDDLISVIIIMRDQAPVAELNASLRASRASLAHRHATVIEALKEAATSQTDLLAELSTSQGRGDVVGFTSHWISNLLVAQITKAYVYELAQRADIAQIESNFTASLIEPIISDPLPGEPTRGIGVTPGLRAINADRVWYELGITGEGVLVGTCDTGVDGNHPALADRWRGNWHPADECWLDVLGGYPNFPQDSGSHGTHVTGTVTGLGAATEDTIGVAWAAHWIACNAIGQGAGPELDNDIIVCYQWLADPDGDPYTTDDVPDVVQNSWRINENFGYDYTDCDSRWWQVIDNAEAAGVITTWSAGNEGPYGHTIGSPADRATTYTNCFSVGAVDATNYDYPWPIAGFSSRGPTGCDVPEDRKIKPEIVAPGVDVYSSIPGGGYTDSFSGTSMAGPHIAGVAALMRQANPDIDVDTVKEIMMATAIDFGEVGEDNSYGWGMVDAYEAVLAVMDGYGNLCGTVTNASDGGVPVVGATVDVVETDRETTTGDDGAYHISILADTYTVTVSCPSFAPQTVPGVIVPDGDTAVLNFQLTDIEPPEISGTTVLPSTEDETGPYRVTSTIQDISTLASTTLYYRVNGGTWSIIPMIVTWDDPNTFSASIPGQMQLAHVEYYVRATDSGRNVGTDPPDAPAEVHEFYVAPTQEVMSEDMESGAPGWTHEIVSYGFGDQWHLSYQRNHTPDGSASWKCGDTGDDDYDNLLDAGLTTPVIELPEVSSLRFWHWMDAEESLAQPGCAYDGGMVEISVDGGPFEQIFPEGGYSHLVRESTFPGPFAPGTAIYSGAFDWTEAVFDLTSFAGPVQFRFRFGTNGITKAEGWFVDDVALDEFLIDFSGVTERSDQLRLVLRAADPNPFTSRTSLSYQLPTQSEVLLQVFDLGGRLVRTLARGEQAAGMYQVEWDGRDAQSRPLPAGVYLSRLQAGSASAAHKIIITR